MGRIETDGDLKLAKLSGAVQRLDQLIDEELQQTAQLRLILVEEQGAVKTKDIDGLNSTLTRKLEILEKLEHFDGERKGLLRQAGFDSNKSGFDSMLKTVTSPDVLIDKWHKLEHSMAECRQLHQVNSQILEIGQHQVQQVLGILLGHQEEALNTYDQKGSKNVPLTTHTYVKA